MLRIFQSICLLIMMIDITNATNMDQNVKTVFISKVVDHPALEATVNGIIDGLKVAGYTCDKNLKLKVESAQANVSLASQIAAKFVSQNPDVVVGVGTISAQSYIKYATKNELKVIFSSITDPLGAGLVKSLDKPGVNISGVSNFIDLESQLSLFKKIQPNLKRIGILYNSGEANSVSIVEKLIELCSKFGITLVQQTANKSSEVSQSAQNLASQVDAIFISNDNTALSSLQTIINTANANKIPVYLSDTDAVEQGGLAALGPNQYEIGLQTASMIVMALNGGDIKSMSVEFPKKVDLYINLKAAKKLGINISDEILKTAAKVYQ